jgi:hypothetical protein
MSCTATKRVLKAAQACVEIVKKSQPSWAEDASRICETLKKLQPCFPLYSSFKNLADPNDLKKPHVFMNEGAQAKLAEFYLCSALQLRRQEVEAAGQDNSKLLALIGSTANECVEPFFDDVRKFLADYDKNLHKELEDTTVYQTIDMRLFWHHNFLASSAELYSDYLASFDRVCDGNDLDINLFKRDIDLVNKAQKVYDKWLDGSVMPLKGQIKNVLLDVGVIYGERAYECAPAQQAAQ